MSDNGSKSKIFKEKKQLQEDFKEVFNAQEETKDEHDQKAKEDRRKAVLDKHETNTLDTLAQENAHILGEKEKGHFTEDR